MSDSEATTSNQPCPKCQKPLDPGIRFCPHCGTALLDTAATRADVSTPTGGLRPVSREVELPTIVGGRYQLLELRGGGGMAKVYRATDLTLEREVAVKLMNAELRSEAEFDARFQREAKIASQLADPHIVVVHDFGLDAEHGPYLVMEFLHGQSLRERITSSGPLPLKAGLQLAGQLVLALIHAHEKGIVHRDIKPDNIFLLNVSGVRLHTRVLDFGIARIYRRDDASKAETITHAGAVLGTPRYMSPEQLAGQPVETKSDLYSAGLVIFEALTGQIPFPGGKRLTEWCPEASPGLQELLEQCLKPNPAERPPTAVEVYLRLQELGKASGILLLPPGAMDRLVAVRKLSEPTQEYQPDPKGRIRRRVFLTLGAVAVAAVLLLLGRWLFGLVWPTPGASGPEAVLQVRIGDSLGSVEERLRLTKAEVGNPWSKESLRAKLGQVLRLEDLGVPLDDVPHLLTRYTEGSRPTVVIFSRDKVVGVVGGSDAATGRGLRTGQGMQRLYDLYPEVVASREVKTEDGHIEVRRYDERGVGFEVRSGKVAGMALYPVK